MQITTTIDKDAHITAHDTRYAAFVTVEWPGTELQLIVRDFEAARQLAASLELCKPRNCFVADVEAAEPAGWRDILKFPSA